MRETGIMQITEQRLKEILSRAGKLRIAVLGDLMVDVYLIGSASRMSQEAPVPVLRVRKTERRPGGAANVMRNITSFGAKAIAFGVIGEDAAGEELRRLLAESGIDATRLAVDRKRKTTEKMRVMTANQQIVRVDFEDVFPVSRAVAAKMEKQLAALIRERKIDAVIFEDYNKGLMDRETIQHLADLVVLNDQVADLLVTGIPAGIPIFDDADTHAVRINFLSHIFCLLPYAFSATTMVMWLVRLRMRVALPCALGLKRFRVGP